MYQTRILPVAEPNALGQFQPSSSSASSSTPANLNHWDAADPSVPGMDALTTAAQHIRTTDIPVGFPTETVYGLGADATRSGAVRGIFTVKGRPSDNPLIVHVCDLDMLRGLIAGGGKETETIPSIYLPLIERFWPGPLTILLPVPSPSLPPAEAPKWTLAPEVTAGLATFGARLPAYHDVSKGGNSKAQGQTQTAVEQETELKPRAPGMKYKHYSPKARVVLFEDWRSEARSLERLVEEVQSEGASASSIGVIRTATWPALQGSSALQALVKANGSSAPKLEVTTGGSTVVYNLEEYTAENNTKVLELDLGRDVPSIAHGLFSALRDLDTRGADVILVEGIDDRGDDMASAVMNRLRKAASDVR